MHLKILRKVVNNRINSLIYLRPVFFWTEREKVVKFPFIDSIKNFKKTIMTLTILRDWESLLDSECHALN